MIDSKRVRIAVTVPPKDSDKIRQALGEVGAGILGDYTFCSFVVTGKGYSKPNEDADPHIGTPGKLEVIDEHLISVVCDSNKAKAAIKAVKKAHPYEEVAFEITPLIDEADL